MKTNAGTLAAPFPYFGGKSSACDLVWRSFGAVANYVEPFAGSAAMILGAPDGKRVETINDMDGFVSNFWRAISKSPDEVAHYADWPCNEVDLFSRHSWLVRQTNSLVENLNADPEWFDPKIAGWWCWGSCNWIGSGWCSGKGPWVHDGQSIIDGRKLPHLGDAGRGINRQIPHLGDAGRGINRKLPHLSAGRGERRVFIMEWFSILSNRLRDVRVTCGDWTRVVKDSVTTSHGLTAVFLDPPYTKGEMDYSVGGVGTDLPMQVQAWAKQNGANEKLRIALCGHAMEHEALTSSGWTTRNWTVSGGYARTEEARSNSALETIWFSPHCLPEDPIMDLFSQPQERR